MLKVLTLVGTRPEIIRLSECIKIFDTVFDHKLIHTGQNYDKQLNEVFFSDFNLRVPDEYLNCAGKTVAETVASIFVKFENVLNIEGPDCVIILGDTNSALSAYIAKRKKIPIFHIEAGNRCFDLNTPEEINRKIVDHTADINITYSEIARSYLIAEGINPAQIFKLGSPIKEVYLANKAKVDNSKILTELGLQPKKYIVISMHREESVDSENKLVSKINLIQELSEQFDKKIIFSTHPRTRSRINKLGENKIKTSNITFCEPFGYLDYIKLQKESYVVVSDSGSITEEASVVGFDAINFRKNNERPEGFIEGAAMMIDDDLENLTSAIKFLKSSKKPVRTVDDYNVGNFSEKLVKLIFSYTSFVNREVWKKNL